ncbi:DUF4190 domain-containing protein [Leucobacter coleopterorum]|uniref:DUF4190 domain-containing protein n=1 Tax=Leucobacter coleopterorum TaxID=2714933 RepID=A0ABX6JVI3_9MICO|nr:DUF4190 domain-containing protein [Leucobacter coleopterorum]QIM18272.1 DUF4190 domain-containing protein [Leucobacter coleopterorum]
MSDPNTPDGLNPEQPAVPEQPVAPGQPAQPQQPAAPAQPTQEFPSAEQFPPAPPQQPTQPFQPTQPAMTVQPPQATPPGAYPGAAQPPTPPGVPGGYPGYQGVPQPTQTKGLAISALIVGIASLVLFLIPFVGILGGIAAVVLGVLALKKAQSKGMSITGLITGGVAILASGAVLIFSLVILNTASDSLNKLSDDLQKSSEELNSATEDLPSLGDDSSSSDSSDDSSSSSSASDDRSPEFCAALDKISTVSSSGLEATEEIKAAFGALAEVKSPNQEVYKKYYSFVTDPTSAQGADFEAILKEFSSAVFDDTMACL